MTPVKAPADLTELPNWVLWRYEKRGDKRTKVPYSTSGNAASTINPLEWGTFEEVFDYYASHSRQYSGMGVVFDGQGMCGVDLDDCLDEAGEVKAWAQPIISKFSDTYMERSPSGTGVKIWCRAKLPGAGVSEDYGDGCIEIYDRSRYFAFTGDTFRGAPLSVEPCQDSVDWLLALVGRDKTGPSTATTPKNAFDMPAFIERYIRPLGWEIKGPFTNQHPIIGGWKWRIEDGCPFQRDYAGGSPSLQVTAKGAASFKCFCGDHETKTWQDLKALVGAATPPWSMPQPPDPPAEEQWGEEEPPVIVGGDWREMLHVTGKKNEPRPVLINADIALRYSPEWEGVLAFDEFKQKIRVVAPPPIGGAVPRDWTDSDDTKTAVWMQANGIYVGRDTVSSCVQSLSAERKIHAVRDYLTSLKWDQEPRVDSWLTRYCGAAQTEYVMSAGRLWLISAVARIMRPGCQADYMLVLEGEQGVRKSSALKTLASQEWFCDQQPDLHDKDSQMQLSGTWIVEWGELNALKRVEITAVKSFISRRVEKYRPPYGRYTIEVPRQCVFAGSTNERDWIKDETGGRRFWPAWCERIDLDALERDRDQIWAEAFHLFSIGERWWPEEASTARFTDEQEQRMPDDPWKDTIERFVARRVGGEVTIAEVLTDGIRMSVSAQTQNEKNRVGRVLRSLGWTYKQIRTPNGWWRGYTK